MESAPELRDLMRRFFEAANAGDVDFIDRAYSRQAGTLQIGTDAAEWWEGGDAIAQVWRNQIGALGGTMPVTANEVQAWRAGEVGWVACRGAFNIPGQPEVPFRFTGVCLREDGEWKLVQGHASVGAANEETIGQDLPIE